jgi:hypothetical protein
MMTSHEKILQRVLLAADTRQRELLDHDLARSRQHKGASVSATTARHLWNKGVLADWQHTFLQHLADGARRMSSWQISGAPRYQSPYFAICSMIRKSATEARRPLVGQSFTVTQTRGGYCKCEHPLIGALPCFASPFPRCAAIQLNDLTRSAGSQLRGFAPRLALCAKPTRDPSVI